MKTSAVPTRQDFETRRLSEITGLKQLHQQQASAFDLLDAENRDLQNHATQYGINLEALTAGGSTATASTEGSGRGRKATPFRSEIVTYAKDTKQFSLKSMIKSLTKAGSVKKTDTKTILQTVQTLTTSGKLRKTRKTDDEGQVIFEFVS